MGQDDRDKGRDNSYSTPLPPPRPSFSYAARPSTDSIRSLADHSYSPLFTNGLYNSAIMDHHRPNPPSPPGPAEHLVNVNVSNLPDPSTFSTPAKKKSSSSLISSLSSKSPFSRRRTRKQSTATVTDQSINSVGGYVNGATNTNTPGKNSLASSQSSLKTSASPVKKKSSTSPYKSPAKKNAEAGLKASLKRLEMENRAKGRTPGGDGSSSASGSGTGTGTGKGKSSSAPSMVQGEFFRSPPQSQDRRGREGGMFGPSSGALEAGHTACKGDDGDIEMMDVDPATDLQNDIAALETINDILGLPSDKPRPVQQVPKKKRSLLGFAVRGGSKVPFVDDDGNKAAGESVGRKSGGWVRASMEHFSRDAPTPPPMTPLPPLPQMMDKLSVNASSNTAESNDPSSKDSNGRRTNLKPFRLRSLLNLNMMGTPKKQQAPTLQMHASPASFIGGGRYSPGESPLDDHEPFSPPFNKITRNNSFEKAGLDLPPRPGTSLGLYTPKKQIPNANPPGRSGSNALGVTTNASTPILGLPTSSHWSNSNPVQQGRGKMSVGPGGRMPPPRPSSRPSLGPEKVLAGRPSLSESRERALFPPLRGLPTGQTGSLASRSKIPLLPRSSSNNILSERSNSDKRAGKVFADKAESPTDGLPFKNGDGWSTPYPPNETVDVEIGRSDMGYPFPAIPKIKSRSSSRASILDPIEMREPNKTSRSRFDSSAFEYQAFETDNLVSRSAAAGKGSRESSPPLSGKSGYETTKSSGFLSSRPGSRIGGTIDELNEDKENRSNSNLRNNKVTGMSLGRSRPLPAVFGGRETMRG